MSDFIPYGDLWKAEVMKNTKEFITDMLKRVALENAALRSKLATVTADIRKNYVPMDYAIGLQRAIEYHSKGKEVPVDIAAVCPHHADMLNAALKGGKG